MKLLRVLDGEAAWPPPVWLMRQAGRYLPEYRRLRDRAGDFLSLCLNPELAAEVTLQPIRRYGFDAAILFSDILILPMAMGQALSFAEGEGPRLPPLQTLDELDGARAGETYAPVLKTVAQTRAALSPEVALIGFCGGPFTVACYMLDGKGGGFPRTLALAYEQPAFLAALIERLVQASIAYLDGQIRAGADCLMIFESWAGIVPPALFDQLVIVPHRQIVEGVRARHPGARFIGFARLAGLRLADYARGSAVNAVGVDTTTPPRAAVAAVPAGMALQGNLDPLLLKVGGAALEAGVRDVLAGFAGAPHIFNLGHGVTPDVPVDHVTAMLAAIRGA